REAIETSDQFGLINAICIAVYWIGKVLAFVIWPLLSPALVFGALLITLDIFAKDYPKLMRGFNFRLIGFFILCLIASVYMILIIDLIFNVAFWSTAPTEYSKPISVEGLGDVHFYEHGLWWTSLGIVAVISTMLVLIILEIIVGQKRGSNEVREKRKANLLFIYPFILIFLISKTIPYIITFGPRLKTLNNLVDLFSLLLIIFLGIFRVLGIQEDSKMHNSGKKEKTSLSERMNLIPPYVRALFVFFLAFSSFYISIEANLILTLFGVQNISRFVRVLLSVIGIFSVISFVFWRYKPFGKTISPGSNDGE
ncbi:MAG: hypothetical protein ACFFDC_15945, partial [Promethearchaeota archaeon]